jgi:hypothetical protein
MNDDAVIPPGHKSWVVGNEPVVGIDFTGLKEYAKSRNSYPVTIFLKFNELITDNTDSDTMLHTFTVGYNAPNVTRFNVFI